MIAHFGVVFILLSFSKMTSASVLIAAFCVGLLAAQPVAPRTDPKAVERRIEDIRSRLERTSPTTPQQKELAAFAEKYLAEANRALNDGKRSQARQLADAADACRRPIDHLQRIATGRAPARPPGETETAHDRLRQIYFRLRLCDFFLQQIPPPAPARLLELARGFYERAVQTDQANDGAMADDYASASDDLTHALESLAQAAVP